MLKTEKATNFDASLRLGRFIPLAAELYALYVLINRNVFAVFAMCRYGIINFCGFMARLFIPIRFRKLRIKL